MGQYYKVFFLAPKSAAAKAAAEPGPTAGAAAAVVEGGAAHGGAGASDGKETILCYIEPYLFCRGTKLLEMAHAIGFPNGLTAALEYQLSPEGRFHRTRVVFAGDYAECEPCGDNLYHMGPERALEELDAPSQAPAGVSMDDYVYIVNHTKKQFVRKDWHVVDSDSESGSGSGSGSDSDSMPRRRSGCEGEIPCHPLPILTCEGCGAGGGDYRGSYAHVGAWARDEISVEKAAPAGYEPLEFDAWYD